jgi:hypothetical protein
MISSALSGEASLVHIISTSRKVWPHTLSRQRRKYGAVLYAGMMIETFGRILFPDLLFFGGCQMGAQTRRDSLGRGFMQVPQQTIRQSADVTHKQIFATGGKARGKHGIRYFPIFARVP